MTEVIYDYGEFICLSIGMWVEVLSNLRNNMSKDFFNFAVGKRVSN